MIGSAGHGSLFAPQHELATQLLKALPENGDGAHDLSHLNRVWGAVCAIQSVEGGDLEILLAATLLHDAWPVEKNSPDRSMASRRAAAMATSLLTTLGWPADRIALVAHAVAAHSNSARIAPETLEARILWDADRLDAIGAIGIARCFYTGGRLTQKLYDIADPRAKHRNLDDVSFTIDHFQAKLSRVANSMATMTGRELAAKRQARLQVFVDDFLNEVDPANLTLNRTRGSIRSEGRR